MASIAASALERLQVISSGLCRDADIRVVAGPGNAWYFTPATRTITVGSDDLSESGPEYCAGVLAHEVGHVFISRYLELAPDFEVPQILMQFLNGIEDPRVNTWIKGRYPGAVLWQERMRDRDVVPVTNRMPMWFRFSLECAREEYLAWSPASTVGPVPSAVMKELDRTREARRGYAETLPPENLLPPVHPRETRLRYDELIAHRFQGNSLGPSPGTWEQTVRLSQHDALELAIRELLPSLKKMLELDLGRIADFIRCTPGGRSAAKKALGSDDALAAFLGEAMAHLEDALSFEIPEGEERRLALRILTRQAENQNRPAGQTGEPMLGGPTPPPTGPGGRPPASARRPLQPVRLPPPEDLYERTRLSITDQIDTLTAKLEELFQPRRRMREKTGLPHGDRIDLKKLVAFEADVKLYRQLWRRKTVPDRRSFAISVLVDLSGSMEQDGKIQAAFRGMVLFAEVLHRHQVDFSINGFQDNLIPFHPFGSPFDAVTRKGLEGMILEVQGKRTGGHNQPSDNHDGPCLTKAALELADQPATDRMLVAISDGRPTGPGDGDGNLRRAIATVQAMEPPIDLVGLGIGAGTEHVGGFYPRSKSGIPQARLAEEVGAVIREALLA